jgi:hypothetical protein
MKIHSKVLQLFLAYRVTDIWKDRAILTEASETANMPTNWSRGHYMWRNGCEFAKPEQGTLWIFTVEISRSVTQTDSHF